MKRSFIERRSLRLAAGVVFFLSLFISCAAGPPVKYYEVSETYNASDVKSVGILVVRMGNYFPSSTIPLTPETDFSIRVPKHGWHGAITEESRDVYIEDEKRLKESFPFYPATTEKPIRYLTDHYTFEFYKNFSPDIYQMLQETFTAKGYEVVDMAALSESWEKPVSESTIAEIVENSKGVVDSLAVFQYLDIGSSTSRVGAISGDRKGFVNLDYSLYMFDTETGGEILYYKKDFYAGAILAMLNDPEIMEDPLYKDKIKRYEKGFGGWVTYYFVNELPDEVITKKVMNYIKEGCEIKDKSLGSVKWTGLMSVIPGR